MAMIRCYRDNYGIGRVDVLALHPNVGFLDGDIQNSTLACKEMLEIVDAIAAGNQAEWCGTGNSHTVTIKLTGVTIENIWDESPGIAELSLDEFRECLSEWLAFISA